MAIDPYMNPFPGQGGMQGLGMMGSYPINDSENQMMNSLMSDKNVPKDILQKYWWVFTKDVILTFLDKDRKKEKMLTFDISRIDYLTTLPYYDYTFEIEQELNNVRGIYDIKLDRALGTDSASQVNERIAQKSQFNESRQFMSDGTGSSVKGGFLGKLLNRNR